MRLLFNYGSIGFLCLSAIILIALQMHIVGWLILLIGLTLLPFCQKNFAKDLFLLYISIALLGLTPISTDISYLHIFIMSIPLGMAVLIPYLVSRFVYKDYLVRFKFHHGRRWYKTEILYIFFTFVVGYFLLPFILQSTGSYHNWTVTLGIRNLLVLFVGTQALGLWDELFFISTTLGILRRHFPFYFANIFQAIMMTSFLYELGFRGWIFGITFVFSLIQGYIFKKTESLFYVITIHLTLDLILYFALIHAYYPTLLPIFFI